MEHQKIEVLVRYRDLAGDYLIQPIFYLLGSFKVFQIRFGAFNEVIMIKRSIEIHYQIEIQ